MSVLPIVVVWGLKATLVLSFAWLVALLLRRSSAARRHFVWTLAVAAVLTLPVVSALSPRLDVPVLPALSVTVSPEKAMDRAGEPSSVPSPTAIVDVGDPSPGVAMQQPQETEEGAPKSFTITQLLWAIWGAGAAILVSLVFSSLAGTAMLARRATLHDPVLSAEFDDARRALGVGPSARLAIADDATMPMTWGTWRPTVLLPAAATTWSPARRRAVLMHELAHVRRRDWLTQLAARMVCALYWWHPMAWMAAKKLREEREHACDDLVLAHGARASDYASELLDIARSLRAPPVAALASVAMARQTQLAGRLLAVLDGARLRAPVPRRAAITGALVAAALVVPAGGLRLARAAPPAAVGLQASFSEPVGLPPLELESPAVTQPREGRATPLGLLQPATTPPRTLCDWSRTGDSQSSSTQIDDHRATIRIVVDECELFVRTRGQVRFSSDDRSIDGLESDGYFEIEERRDRERRRAEFSSRGGGIDRRWLVNGREESWSTEADEWLQGALLVMFRRTSFEARARAERIHARAGKQGLLDEIAYLHSNSALGTYFTVLLERESVTPQEAQRLADLAGERISSSSTLSRVLIALVTNSGTDENTRAAIVRSARSISSSSAKGRVLVAAVEVAPLTPVLADAVLETAAGISSSSEKARVLIAVNQQVPAGRSLPARYVSTASGISSSSELSRVLVNLLERESVSSEQIATALTVSRGISSSSERGRVLRTCVERHGLDDRTRSPFFEAVRGISSSSERERVLRAVADTRPDPASVALLIESSRGISSSSSRANVLVSVARAGLLRTDDLRNAYRDAAQGISSRSERERALRALGDA